MYRDGEKKVLYEYVCGLLPDSLETVCANYLSVYEDIGEIRLRLDAPLSFTGAGRNIVTGLICTRSDIDYTISKMTEGNYSKYGESLCAGYVPLAHGCRAGVAGRVFASEGKVRLLISVESICIRIPRKRITDVENIVGFLKENEYTSGLLIISPPGGGKTTILRSLAFRLSSPGISRRVAVVDTLDELSFDGGTSLCDRLVGYPKAVGIVTACRYLAPEYVICDEICGEEEARAILDTQHTGVPLIASAHAGDFPDLKLKKNIRILLESRVFAAVCRVRFDGNGSEMRIKRTEEILGEDEL